MADPGRGNNLVGRSGSRWKRPSTCRDCTQPIDYQAGKYMCVEVSPAAPGRLPTFIVVCRACWRKNHKPRPAPPRPGVLGRLATALRGECRKLVGQEFSARMTKPWVPEPREGRGDGGDHEDL